MSAKDVRGWWIPDAAFALLRVFIAAMIARHGLQDHFGVLLAGADAWVGAPALLTDRWLAATLQIAAGLLLAAGLFARSAALALTAIVVLGYFAPAPAAGPWIVDGREPIALYSGILLAFAIIGPGLFSLDALRGKRPRRKRGGWTVSMSPWLTRQYRRRELTR